MIVQIELGWALVLAWAAFFICEFFVFKLAVGSRNVTKEMDEGKAIKVHFIDLSNEDDEDQGDFDA